MQIENSKLQEVTRLVQTDYPIEAENIENFICADWPEGELHQAWLDTADANEIAAWVMAGIKNLSEEELGEL